MGKIVGGWSLSSIGLWHTGHPLTVNMDLGTDRNPSRRLRSTDLFLYLPASQWQRPDQPAPRPRSRCPVDCCRARGLNGLPLINAAAFQAPPVDANGNFTRYGNEPNGVIRALDSWQIDLALTKETKLTERVSMEFAVQAFNIFNHVQLGDPWDPEPRLTLPEPWWEPVTNFRSGNFGLINYDGRISTTTTTTWRPRTRAPACRGNYSSWCASCSSSVGSSQCMPVIVRHASG